MRDNYYVRVYLCCLSVVMEIGRNGDDLKSQLWLTEQNEREVRSRPRGKCTAGSSKNVWRRTASAGHESYEENYIHRKYSCIAQAYISLMQRRENFLAMELKLKMHRNIRIKF